MTPEPCTPPAGTEADLALKRAFNRFWLGYEPDADWETSDIAERAFFAGWRSHADMSLATIERLKQELAEARAAIRDFDTVTQNWAGADSVATRHQAVIAKAKS